MSTTGELSWRIVSLESVTSTPWRNGGGTTRELLMWPDVADGWRVRLSVAEVTSDGPFSRFDNTQRWFAVLRGSGVILDIDGRTTTLTTSSAPLRFSGEAQTHCRLLDGATQDFNLMLRGAEGTLSRRSGRLAMNLNGCALAALYTASTEAILIADGHRTHIPPDSLCWRSMPEPDLTSETNAVTVSGRDMLWLEIAR